MALEIPARAIRSKQSHPNWKGRRKTLFTDGMIFYAESLKIAQKEPVRTNK
jgi:hypothetical protein